MAQTVILALGTSQADSSDVVVSPGTTVSVGAYVNSGDIPQTLLVMQRTPGAVVTVSALYAGRPSIALTGPGTYFVRRNAGGQTQVGAYKEA